MQPQLPDSTPFLVAIIKRATDWQRLLHAQTYHIPLTQYGKFTHCPGIAWYLPGWHSTPYRVTHWALIEDVRICTRVTYLPDEPCHAQAQAWYAVLRVGALSTLTPPLQSQRWRRIGVYGTTWGALTRAAQLEHLTRYAPDYDAVAGQERATKSTMSTII